MTTPTNPPDILARFRRLTTLLDNAFTIPGTRIRFGLDPIIGLVPGLGDLVTSGIALWMILEARRLGISRSVQVKMVANVLLDFLVGSIPLLGDLLDFAFKANVRNLKLLERELQRSR